MTNGNKKRTFRVVATRVSKSNLSSPKVARILSYEPGERQPKEIKEPVFVREISNMRRVLQKVKYIAFEDGAVTVCFKGNSDKIALIDKKLILRTSRKPNFFDASKINIASVQDLNVD